jgi:hypothetical protein
VSIPQQSFGGSGAGPKMMCERLCVVSVGGVCRVEQYDLVRLGLSFSRLLMSLGLGYIRVVEPLLLGGLHRMQRHLADSGGLEA